jgi:hypothetical protein
MAVFASLANGLGLIYTLLKERASISGGTTVRLKRDQLLRKAKETLSWLCVSSLIVFCFLMVESRGFASTTTKDIYIAQNAAGAANGADCADALPVSWFNNAANWGNGPTQIGPGTTVHLCGTFTGSAGQTLLTFQGSGTSGNVITLKFETNAQLNAPYWSGSNGAILVPGGTSFIVIDGGTNGIIQNTDNGSSSAGYHNQQASTMIWAKNCASCEIKNLTLANVYVHTDVNDTVPSGNSENCINFGGSNWLIHNNVMHDAGWCLAQQVPQNQTDDNVRVYNNEVYHFGHGTTCGGLPNGILNNYYFYNNHLHDMFNWGTNSDKYHQDGIHCFTTSAGSKTNDLWVYNNIFDGNEGNCCVTSWIYLEGSSSIWTDSGGRAHIFNNFFYGALALSNGQLSINGGGVTRGPHEVYNNTIIGASGSSGSCFNDRGGQSGSSVILENNAFQGCTTLISMDAAVSSLTANNNAYGNSSGGSNSFAWDTHSNTSSFATWQSNSAQDANSVANLANSNGNMMDSAGHPQSGSPVIGLGINLTSLGILALDNDLAGGARPSAGAWDAGAYQSGAIIARPAPPTGLTATVQ